MPDLPYFLHDTVDVVEVDNVFARDLRDALRKLDRAAVGPAMLDTNERHAVVNAIDYLSAKIMHGDRETGAAALAAVVRKALK